MHAHRPSSPHKGRVVALTLSFALAAAIGCGEGSGLVGGECRAPYVECDLVCIDVSSDPAHCGACDVACAPGVACVAGHCGGASGSVTSSGPASDGPLGVFGTLRRQGDAGAHADALGDDGGGDDARTGDGSGDDGAQSDGGGADAAGTDGSSSTDGGAGDDGAVSGDSSAATDSSVSTSDATTSDAGASGNDAATADGSAVDGSTADVSLPEAGDACSPPYVQNDHCGDCFTVCSGVNDTCRQQPDTSYACVPFCEPPLSRCGNACLDLMNDGDNCGACGRVCASNICIQGKCQGAASGDIVYIGHDYVTTPTRTSQARLLENAVYLAPRSPVRVLAYERWTPGLSNAHVATILADAEKRTGRAIQLTITVKDTDVADATLATTDVVLVLDQSLAPAAALGTLGASWSAPLADFTHKGGVFVALDGATGSAAMPQLVTATGLLSVTDHHLVGLSEQFEVMAPADGVGIGVVTPFAMRPNSSRFTTEANGGRVSWVVRHVDTGEPTVVHKIAP